MSEKEKQLKNENQDLRAKIEECRHYLMGVRPSDLTVEDALESLGFNRSGYEFEL